MKNILTLIFLFTSSLLMAQNVEKTWLAIDSAYRQGNVKSIRPQVEAALAQARTSNDVPMTIKGVYYLGMIELATSADEDAINPIFELFRNEISEANGVNKRVWQVHYAMLYQKWWEENRWRLVRRTNVEALATEDIRFWTEKNFHKRIQEIYADVLSNKDELVAAPATAWKNLFELSKDNIQSLELIPTLYDAFTHYYIDYLEQQNEPVAEKLTVLVDMNKKKELTAAYLYNKSILFKDQIDKLTQLVKEHPSHWYTAEIYRQLARHYYEKGDKESYIKVLEMHQDVQKAFPDAQATSSIASLAESIRATSFSVETEKYIPEKTNTPIRITHRNLSRLYVRVLDYNIGIKDLNMEDANRALSNQYKDSPERYAAFLAQYKAVQEYTIDMRPFDDYQSHSAVFRLQGLPKGRYIVLFCEDDNFSYGSALEYTEVYAGSSAVSYDGKFWVTDRMSGNPLSKKGIQVYHMQKSDAGEKYELVKTLSSDRNGNAAYTSDRPFFYRLTNDPVFYRYQRYHYPQPRESAPVETLNTVFFTDRAIYRPGQTVYFKGIVTSSLARSVKAEAKRELKVILRDANGQELQSLVLVSNEFGSVHGEFVLPTGILTGNFLLESSLNGYHSFLVEEYKRPRFKVEIARPTGAYQLGDSVTIQGKAEAFSGADMDGAAVEYRVYRQSFYPFRYWGKPISEPEVMVGSGRTTTSPTGQFQFPFHATPSRERRDTTDYRMYQYRIEATVTDLNGETQSASAWVNVGDQKMILNAKIDQEANVRALDSLLIDATNLNGEPITAKGRVRIYALVPPSRKVRHSMYSVDYQYYSKEAFVKLFPHEPYGEESQPESWEKGSIILDHRFTSPSRVHVPKANQLKEGYYLISLSASTGEMNQQVVYLFNDSKPTTPHQTLTVRADKAHYEPGDVAKVALSTGAAPLHLVVRIEADGKLIREENVRLTGKRHVMEIPIKESFLGGAYVHYSYVRFNRHEQGSLRLEVPYNHKKLQVTTEVKRDKMAPGGLASWSFTVRGPKKDKVMAEVLASMYDASLDQFASNSFDYNPYRFYTGARQGFGYGNQAFEMARMLTIHFTNPYPNFGARFRHPNLNTYDFTFQRYREVRFANATMARQEKMMDAPVPEAAVAESLDLAGEGAPAESASTNPTDAIHARKVLQETAFFFPTIATNAEGDIRFEFTVPESLTSWKLMAFAHTTDLKTGYFETQLKTSKDLMVLPNLPRFFRAGDEVTLSAKIANLSGSQVSGTAQLMLLDAISLEPIAKLFGHTGAPVEFTISPNQSAPVSWNMHIPENVPAVVVRMVASAGDFSDGEETVVPLVTNRILLTETLPLSIREHQKKTFTLEKLHHAQKAEHFRLTFEMTSNPIWYAVFSLPYLREVPYQNAEQIFSRFYANAVSHQLITSQPKIKAVFDDWNKKGQLKSKLQVNDELKNVMLEETPWVFEATQEAEQQKRIAVLFEMNKMKNETAASLAQLNRAQLPSGGFPWFEGGPENEFITTHIVTGFGHLQKLGVETSTQGAEHLLSNAIRFLDQRQLTYYKEQKERKKSALDYATGIHYLYARSFFLEKYPIPASLDSLCGIYIANIQKEKATLPLHLQGMAALVLKRLGKGQAAEALLQLISETAVASDEMGTYWKSNQAGWYWYQSPVETQAVLIEAYDEIAQDIQRVEDMKVWLLKNRQTHRWSSTKATTKAVYALLQSGKSGLNAEDGITVQLGQEALDISGGQTGSGYFKKSWKATEIHPNMAAVTLEKSSPGTAWGALYWQYFEDLDNVSSAKTGIALHKKLYLKKPSPTGMVLQEITPNTTLEVGDLIAVRLEIRTDRDMEFVHIKDMRASGFEPVNFRSGYRWQDGLGYYESTRDLASHFFADRMAKGTYVFEYELRANNSGVFSNGITQMQNMYAPELSAHSEGVTVRIR